MINVDPLVIRSVVVLLFRNLQACDRWDPRNDFRPEEIDGVRICGQMLIDKIIRFVDYVIDIDHFDKFVIIIDYCLSFQPHTI